MKYHIVLFHPAHSKSRLNSFFSNEEINEFNKTKKIIRNIIKKEQKSNSAKKTIADVLWYDLHSEDSMSTLRHDLQDEDELVIHADGNPFVIGTHSSSNFDLTACQLASLLFEYLNTILSKDDNSININLLICNSATTFMIEKSIEVNFAKDTSIALAQLGCTDVKVTGYTGFVKESDNGKFSVCSYQNYDEANEIKTNNHGNIHECCITYINGQMEPVKPGQLRKILQITPTSMAYWGGKQCAKFRENYLFEQANSSHTHNKKDQKVDELFSNKIDDNFLFDQSSNVYAFFERQRTIPLITNDSENADLMSINIE